MTDSKTDALATSATNANRADIDSWATRLGATAIVYGATELSSMSEDQKAIAYITIGSLMIITFIPLWRYTRRIVPADSAVSLFLCLFLWIATFIFMWPKGTIIILELAFNNPMYLTVTLVVIGVLIILLGFIKRKIRSKKASPASGINTSKPQE